MEREQEMEWDAAQRLEIHVDLVSAAKTHLNFLAAVDRNRSLYHGPALHKAIYRLNPVRYQKDCKELYGRILDNYNVISSLQATPASLEATHSIWKELYPSEPFELNLATQPTIEIEKCTNYDLVLAAQRQSPFFYQVCRLHMNDTRYIKGAVARYRGFLHLIKRNFEKAIKSFSVPTYDIDLIWHTHQLHPVAYCKDLLNIMGKVLEHDDTDSDRTKGQKLDVGFTVTTKRFEEMYGRRYWRAGAMYRGNAPSPVATTAPYTQFTSKTVPSSDGNSKMSLPTLHVFEVMLEFVNVRDLPEDHKGRRLIVNFTKTQPDSIFNVKRSLTIFSETGEKQVASFQCEPTGKLLLELVSISPITKLSKPVGTASISLEDFLSMHSNLMLEQWLDVRLGSDSMECKLTGLRVAISVTVPSSAPYELCMARPQLFSKNSCLFSLPVRVQCSKRWTRIVDESGNLVLTLQMRDAKRLKGQQECKRRQVVGITEFQETYVLAEIMDSEWSLINSSWSVKLPDINVDDNGHLLELMGPHTVRLFIGGRLDYESRRCEKHKSKDNLEPHLVTAIEFSAEDPYGKAVALLDLESGAIKVKEEWFLLPAVVVAFIVSDGATKAGYHHLKYGKQKQVGREVEIVKENVATKGGADCNGGSSGRCGDDAKGECGSDKENVAMPMKGEGGCNGGCSGECGSDKALGVSTGGCGNCGGNIAKEVAANAKLSPHEI